MTRKHWTAWLAASVAAFAVIGTLAAQGGASLSGSYVGGLSADELDDVSMYDIDRELYGDEAVGAGRTYSDDAGRFIRPEPRPTPGPADRGKEGMVSRAVGKAIGCAFPPPCAPPDAAAEMASAIFGGLEDDYVTGVALTSSGSVWAAGSTSSPDFPLVDALQAAPGGSGSDVDDAFVLRLSDDFAQIEVSTYLGGAEWDEAQALALAPDGSPIIAGFTFSRDFPLVGPVPSASPCRSNPNACPDLFVARLAPDGRSVTWSVMFGGGGFDSANDLAIDTQGRIFVGGDTTSRDFPVANAYQDRASGGTCGGAARVECEEGFVVAISADGSTLDWSTYLGGRADDSVRGVALDSGGRVYAAGRTTSTDFAVQSAYQPRAGGGTCTGGQERHPCSDGFATVFATDGRSVLWSTYLGGRADDEAADVAVLGNGSAAVVGKSASTDFPVKDALQGELAGGTDAFALVLDAGGLLQSGTYLGGPENDWAGAAAAAGSSVRLAGTAGDGFPAFSPLGGYGGGDSDGFLVTLELGSPTQQPRPTPTQFDWAFSVFVPFVERR